MTENEKYIEMPWSIEDTIENLKELKEHLQMKVLIQNLHGRGEKDAEEVAFDFDRAIQALEEIQQYRAIGTLEELQTAMKYVSLAKMHGTVGKVIDTCAEYEAIGTLEEFKSLKSLFEDDANTPEIVRKMLKEYPAYLAIGSVEECRIAVERMKRYINSDCVVFRNDKKSPYEFPL